jgi:hypothetical protein
MATTTSADTIALGVRDEAPNKGRQRGRFRNSTSDMVTSAFVLDRLTKDPRPTAVKST